MWDQRYLNPFLDNPTVTDLSYGTVVHRQLPITKTHGLMIGWTAMSMFFKRS